MNRFFLLMVGLCVATASPAQQTGSSRQTGLPGKGMVNAGVQVGGSYRYSSGFTGRVVPRLHYALKNGWSVGLEGRYQANGSLSRYVGAGVSTRYYFVRFRQLAVFGQAGATVGQSRNRTFSYPEGSDPLFVRRSEQKARAWQGTAGLGAHFRVSNRWALEATAERTLVNSRGPLKNDSRWQGSAGATYQLNRK